MTDTELARQQVDAALYYINKLHEDYKLDWKSCRLYARLLRRIAHI